MNDRMGIMLSVLMLSVGCGGSDTKPVYEVHGKVTMDGKPFGPTTINLNDRDKDNPKSVVGQVDKDGSVTFTTYDVGDGVPEGSYSVTIGMEMKAPPEPFPMVYMDPESTPLMVEVKPEDGQEITFAIDPKAGGRMFKGPNFGRKGGPDLGAAYSDPAFNAGITPGESDE